MKRTPINPWPWSLNFGYNQAEIIDGATRHLICAGQTSVDAEGNPQHPGDMRGQMSLALDNLETVLKAADMSLANVTPTHPLRHRRRRSPQKLRPARRAIRPPQRRSSNDLTRRHATRHPAPHVRDRGYRRRLTSTFSEILRSRFANPIGGRRGYGSQILLAQAERNHSRFILETPPICVSLTSPDSPSTPQTSTKLLKNFDLLGARFGPLNIAPPNDLTRCHATRHPAPHVRDRGYRRRLISTFSEILRPRFANPIGGPRGYGSQILSRSSGKDRSRFIFETPPM